MRLWRCLRQKSLWSQTLAEAEKLVGKSETGNSLSLQCLLSDEVSAILLNVRKLLGTNHPILKTAKNLLYNGRSNIHAREMLVFTLSKAANHGAQNSQLRSPMDNDQCVDGIYNSQRCLADIMELMFTGNMLHKSLMEVEDMPESDKPNLVLGNKMALLGGDFLLAKCCVALSELKCPDVVGAFGKALADMCEAAFMDDHNCQTANRIENWQQKVELDSGSLLASTCKSAMRIVGHRDQLQSAAYRTGMHLAIAYKIHDDLVKLETGDDEFCATKSCFLSLMPFVMGTEKEIIKAIKSNRNAQNEAKAICYHHRNAAVQEIQQFPACDARTVLINIVNLIGEPCH